MLRQALAAVCLGLTAAGGAAALSAQAPVVTGPAEVVFDWSRDRCERWDIPDAPARAWRDAEGRVRLVAGSERSRASVGPSLDALERDCAVLHEGARADDPAAHDDRTWIASIHTTDGILVEALGHMEFHGHLRPALCAAGDYAACWANAVVALSSRDGGRTFERARREPVAVSPRRYDGRRGRRVGYFNPSNVVLDGEHLYAFVFAEAEGPQRRGACLLRRPVAGGDWRAWDGAAFTVRFADPYAEPVADAAAHVCAPIPGLASTISSVVRHEPSGRFLAVTPATLKGPDGVVRTGIHWTTSTDLLRWTRPEPLLEAPLLWRRDCDAAEVFAYPSLLDADASSRNFDAVDADFWLYLTAAALDDDCRVGPDRDLVRFPVSWPAAADRPRETPSDR